MMRLRWISSKSNWTAAAALADATSEGFDLAEDFTLAAKQDDAPAALHPGGELRWAVFLGAAGRHAANLGGRCGKSSRNAPRPDLAGAVDFVFGGGTLRTRKAPRFEGCRRGLSAAPQEGSHQPAAPYRTVFVPTLRSIKNGALY